MFYRIHKWRKAKVRAVKTVFMDVDLIPSHVYVLDAHLRCFLVNLCKLINIRCVLVVQCLSTIIGFQIRSHFAHSLNTFAIHSKCIIKVWFYYCLKAVLIFNLFILGFSFFPCYFVVWYVLNVFVLLFYLSMYS